MKTHPIIRHADGTIGCLPKGEQFTDEHGTVWTSDGAFGAHADDDEPPFSLTPPTAPARVLRWPIDPRAGDGWEDAVARDGVRVPGYPEYLRSTHWELTCEAKTGRCVLCGDIGRTQLHHVDAGAYARLGQERDGDLTELCDSCHRWHSQPARRAA